MRFGTARRWVASESSVNTPLEPNYVKTFWMNSDNSDNSENSNNPNNPDIPDEEYIRYLVRREVGDHLEIRYVDVTPENRLALTRIKEHQSAIEAWKSLAKKTPKLPGGLENAIRDIVGYASYAHRDDFDNRTTTEIREDAARIADLADELVACLDKGKKTGIHAFGLTAEEMAELPAECQRPLSIGARTFEYLTDDHSKSIWPDWARVAIARIVRGIQSLPSRRSDPTTIHHGSWLWFGEDVEKKLDEYQENNFTSEYKDMTSYGAEQIILRIPTSDQFFIECLQNLSRMARERAENDVSIVPKPNAKNAGKQVFCLNACSALEYYFNSPCIDIVTDIAAAVFDDGNPDGELVKKWWQRRL